VPIAPSSIVPPYRSIWAASAIDATLAAPGGLCVARTVHEQVANKLSVTFVDIGEREVKNIPTPIHVYALVLGGQNPRVLSRQKKDRSLTWPVAVTAASIAAVAVAGLFYFTANRSGGPAGVSSAAVTASEPPAVPPSAPRPPEMLVPEIVPFIPDRQRLAIRTAYMSAPDHKAIAISFVQAAFITDQKDDETAKAAALEACHRAAEPINPGQRCDIYAVGNDVVYGRGRPPMPPEEFADFAGLDEQAAVTIAVATTDTTANIRKALVRFLAERDLSSARSPRAA